MFVCLGFSNGGRLTPSFKLCAVLSKARIKLHPYKSMQYTMGDEPGRLRMCQKFTAPLELMLHNDVRFCYKNTFRPALQIAT